MSCLPCTAATWGEVTAILGTVEILVGMFNIGLGPGRVWHEPLDLASLGAAYWLGAVVRSLRSLCPGLPEATFEMNFLQFVIAGILSVLAGQCPSHCLVGFAVFINIISAILAIVGIVLYGVDTGKLSRHFFCKFGTYTCGDGDNFATRLMRSMDVMLIILASLQLCVSISMIVLAVKALVVGKRNKLEEDVEEFPPGVNPGLKAFLVDSLGPEDKQ
uniref:uncharacterized protein LOC131105341 isoform X1 n=1 Tax=Doryrhamphus excisus TaxID=161450 RepID=UPI0025AE14CF|nr:uncharacterized protein LOC131105341 isoform X1 [Doryrhamphus excisus]XP_057909340.1 uncharacterized protein LOC131105341 isoform X1 [Doryrhamphus excisus]